MLEIIVLIFLARHIGNIARLRGLSPAGYKGLLIALWFGGEIGGFLVGDAMDAQMGCLVLALAGAIMGALISFALAMRVKPIYRESDLLGYAQVR